tara:strand:- start:330 stop:713 length:384 start_codon:yes stop_codon:yes gene_type:complete
MRTAPQTFTNAVELTTHAAGLQLELRGNDIPADVQGILFKMPSSGKAVLRKIDHFKGNNAPSISGIAVTSPGGKGEKLFQNKKTPRQSSLLISQSGFALKEVVVLPIPPVDGSYRFRSVVTVYGLIP